MGRVTVFTLPSCAHCARAKALLTRRGHAFTEISLAESPRRREDMTALCARTSVPQIFLNDAHVGGADDLAALAEADPRAFDARVRAALAAPDPADPRLALPPREGNRNHHGNAPSLAAADDVFPLPESVALESRKPVARFPAGRRLDRVAAVLLVERALGDEIRDRARGLTIHKRAFPGDALVNALVRDAAKTTVEEAEAEAEAFAEEALAAGVLRRVDAEASPEASPEASSEAFPEASPLRSSVLKTVFPFLGARPSASSSASRSFDPRRLYRLQPDASPGVVNGFRAPSCFAVTPPSIPPGLNGTDRDAYAARLRVVFVEAELLALHAGVDAIRASHVDAFTGSVDYRSMRRSAAFARLRDAHAVTLARVDAEAVDAARRVAEEEEEDPANRRRLSDDDDDKNCTPSRRRLFRDASLAFLINVYNLSARIAPATVGAAVSSLARGAYFDAVRTELAGVRLSFNDLENGLIRRNRRAPYTFRSQFADETSDDLARLVRAFTPPAPVDPRVHFALNCGAASCPPVRAFRAATLDADLDLAARAFHETHARFDARAGRLILSAVYKWYREDFGADDGEVALRACEWLPGPEAARVREALGGANSNANSNANGGVFRGLAYEKYDWSSDGDETSPAFRGRADASADVGRVTGFATSGGRRRE